MKEFLTSISSDNLVFICVIMGIVALILAVVISIEIHISNKKYKKLLKESDFDNTALLNLSYDKDIKYVVENEDLEKTRAKIELDALREKIKKEAKKRRKDKNVILALNENNKNLKLRKDDPEEVEEDIEEKISEDYKEEVVNRTEDLGSTTKIAAKVADFESLDKEEVEVEPVKEKEEEKEKYTLELEPVKRTVLEEEYEEPTINVVKEEPKEVEVEIEEKPEKKAEFEIHEEELREIQEVRDQIKEKAKNDAKEEIDNQVDLSLTFDNSDLLQRLNSALRKNEEEKEAHEYQEVEEEPSDEDDAIISYEELQTAQHLRYTDEQMANYVDEKNAVISMNELHNLYAESEKIDVDDNIQYERKIKSVADLPEFNNTSNFQTSPDISPVFGIKKSEEELALEQTANLEKLNEEIKKTNEFLAALKDLKKNLE